MGVVLQARRHQPHACHRRQRDPRHRQGRHAHARREHDAAGPRFRDQVTPTQNTVSPGHTTPYTTAHATPPPFTQQYKPRTSMEMRTHNTHRTQSRGMPVNTDQPIDHYSRYPGKERVGSMDGLTQALYLSMYIHMHIYLSCRALPSHDAQSVGGILSTDVHERLYTRSYLLLYLYTYIHIYIYLTISINVSISDISAVAAVGRRQ